MAFSAVQKRDIRKYLGVAFGFYDLNTRLESMMDTVGANADDSAQVITWLDELAAIDAGQVYTSTSVSTTYGPLKKVDEVEFHKPDSGQSSGRLSPTDRGNTLINALARALGVDDHLPNGDYFKPRTSTGFAFALG